jgi:transcriptional regulator with XRE-family HTH domain
MGKRCIPPLNAQGICEGRLSMDEQERLALRRKIVGIALRQAREQARRTVQVCAALLGISPARYRAYEAGRQDPTLPELEVLAWFFQTPLSALLEPDWRNTSLEEVMAQTAPEFMAIRHRIIGLILRQARETAGKSLREVAAAIGCTPRRLRAYESGERPIPFAELERLAAHLGLSLAALRDTESPIGQAATLLDQSEGFRVLPSEVRAFVTAPVHLPYLRLAMRLAELPADRLRHIAEDLLEITL